MADPASHMTLKWTNGSSYINPGKLRQRTTLVKHIQSDRYEQIHYFAKSQY
jgi:hypothetical protein